MTALDENIWPCLAGCLFDCQLVVEKNHVSCQLRTSSRQLKFDHGKEDGVGDLLLVRQPLFAERCLKVVDTVSKIAI